MTLSEEKEFYSCSFGVSSKPKKPPVPAGNGRKKTKKKKKKNKPVRSISSADGKLSSKLGSRLGRET